MIHDHPFANTLIITLHGPDEPVLEQVYYSVGGGFIQRPGYTPPERGRQPHPFTTMDQLQLALTKYDLDLSRLMLINESALTGADEPTILSGLDQLIEVMIASVERGLSRDGVLPGRIGLQRKAAFLYARAERNRDQLRQGLLKINAAALAASEENAAGGVVVTAPTMGSAGVLPSLIYRLISKKLADRTALRRGLLAAAAIGFLIKHNASIAGAEVGCQGEIGAASAMAAAMLGYILTKGNPAVTANGAEIALEHHLGLTCDPVGGYVQIPCIERNAMGAVKAYNSYLLASAGDPCRQKVGFDQAVAAMLATGRDMSTKYKETSLGGLAVSLAEC